MKNKLKGLFISQGFNCKDLDEKKRIWQKLTDAGYPMFHSPNYDDWLNIVFIDGRFCNFGGVGEPLNESEFFGENEWTPKAGEWVEVSLDGVDWVKRQYLCTIDGIHFCVFNGEDYRLCAEFGEWKYIRQIPMETMTLKEAQEKLRELLNKPSLTIKS
jgi:hypothetical protein